ncbi:MAG: DUF4249 domain-containing protein [Bacteroidia bacterium]|nr:DUF4249 domain-containing protein [Bacteroidia bacterium]
MKIPTSLCLLQLATILAVFGITSCSKVIDISIPDKERKIVVNGLISPDQPVRINLSTSLSVLEKDDFVFITGGVVSLFNEAGLIGKFQEESGGFYFLPDFKPQVGQSYRLTASGDGLKPVETTAIIPSVVPIISVDTATLTDEWGQQQLRLSVKFDDPAGVHNVYSFGVDVTYKEIDYAYMTNTGKKITLQAYLSGYNDQFLKDESLNFYNKLYFDDLLFDGLGKTVEFNISDYSYYNSDTIWLDVKMEQVDPSYYQYVLSNDAYQRAQNNPFSEPVQVFTNIKGGFGIFAGSSFASYPLVIRGMWRFE